MIAVPMTKQRIPAQRGSGKKNYDCFMIISDFK